MPNDNLGTRATALLLIDLQPKFLAAIHESERVVRRSAFLAGVARLLGVEVLGTEQNPSRMGGTHNDLVGCLRSDRVFDKMAFSCGGCAPLIEMLCAQGIETVVIAGIETHICVSQTAHDLLALGMRPVVCADAVSSRTVDRHEIGLARLRDAGVVVAHSESVVYEWMRSAEHPKFREALELVKAAG